MRTCLTSVPTAPRSTTRMPKASRPSCCCTAGAPAAASEARTTLLDRRPPGDHRGRGGADPGTPARAAGHRCEAGLTATSGVKGRRCARSVRRWTRCAPSEDKPVLCGAPPRHPSRPASSRARLRIRACRRDRRHQHGDHRAGRNEGAGGHPGQCDREASDHVVDGDPLNDQQGPQLNDAGKGTGSSA